MASKLAFAGAVGLICLACAAGAEAPRTGGYLHGALAPDTLAILPPAPATGSPRDLADRAIFKATRALEGTPRWALAKRDVDFSVSSMMADFSCAAGVSLDPKTAPILARLLRNLGPDVAAAVNTPKAVYKRQRPYLADEGDICVERSSIPAANFDYPSGHATWGWAMGLIIAELIPDRAGALLNRARAFGESRVVCGVHNLSAVEEGRTAGAALAAALHGDPAFRADLEAARGEMAALRASAAPRPRACDAETALTAKTPWPAP